MASTVQRRDIAGSVQTAASGSSVETLLSDWNQADAGADNAQNRTAAVDVYVKARGVTSNNVNAYHRRQVYFLGYMRTLVRSVGTLLAATEEVEEIGTCDAVVSLSAPSTVIMTLTGASGAGAEAVDWSWEGTITITSTPWENPHNILGDLGPSKYQGTMVNMEIADVSANSPGDGCTNSTRFEGTNERVNMGDVLGFEYNVPFSIVFWAMTSGATYKSVLAKSLSSGTYRGWMVGVYENLNHLVYQFHLRNTLNTNCIQIDSHDATIDPNVWGHVAITYDGSSSSLGAKLYYNGAPAATVSVIDNLTATIANAGSFYLGSNNAAIDWFVGRLCHVAIYDKELSAAEVAEIYNAGDPPDLLNLSTAANLVYWNRCGD